MFYMRRKKDSLVIRLLSRYYFTLSKACIFLYNYKKEEREEGRRSWETLRHTIVISISERWSNADRSLLCPAWVWCHQFDPILHHLIYTFFLHETTRAFSPRHGPPGLGPPAPPLPPISSPTHVLPCVAYKSSLAINLHANVPPWWPMESRCSESRWPQSFARGRATTVHLSRPDREVESNAEGVIDGSFEILKTLASLSRWKTAPIKWNGRRASILDQLPTRRRANFQVRDKFNVD